MPAALLVLLAAADPAADLRALGTEVRAELVRRLPAVTPAGDDDIPALGTCKRPAPEERAQLAKLVVPAGVDETYYVRFGCEDASGVIVETSYDVKRQGNWKIVRIAGGKVTPVVTYQGLSTMDYMEWADEVQVSVRVLVDVDGDGTHDALVVRDQHEGGAMHRDESLSLWSSRTGRLTPLGTFGDGVALANGLAPPFVLEVLRDNEPTRYRCLEARGVIDLCPAIEGTRHVDRVLEIASWFVDGHEYGIDHDKVPDRDLLAEMLAELSVPAARRAQLLAEVPATRPEQRVAREIERWLLGTPLRTYGELVEQPADPRPAEITALAGDQICTMSAADQKRAKAVVIRWIAAHEASVAANWKHPTAPELVMACGDLESGYIAAHWTYTDSKAGQLLARDVVLDVTRARATQLASTTVAGPNYTCAACGFEPPGVGLDSSFYRRDGKRLAIVLAASKDTTVMDFAIDGKPAPVPPGSPAWARLREPESQLRTVLETGTAFWHWDGEWKQVVDVPYTALEPPADLAGLGLRLWRESARVYAIWALKSFDAKAWAGIPSLREQTRRQLVVAGADAELLARIDADSSP